MLSLVQVVSCFVNILLGHLAKMTRKHPPLTCSLSPFHYCRPRAAAQCPQFLNISIFLPPDPLVLSPKIPQSSHGARRSLGSSSNNNKARRRLARPSRLQPRHRAGHRCTLHAGHDASPATLPQSDATQQRRRRVVGLQPSTRAC